MRRLQYQYLKLNILHNTFKIYIVKLVYKGHPIDWSKVAFKHRCGSNSEVVKKRKWPLHRELWLIRDNLVETVNEGHPKDLSKAAVMTGLTTAKDRNIGREMTAIQRLLQWEIGGDCFNKNNF